MGQQVDKTNCSTPTLSCQIQLVYNKGCTRCVIFMWLIRNCCPSLSIKEVIELDSVIDVELVIGKLHQYWVVFLSGYLLLFFLEARISWTISHYVNVSLLSYSYRTQYTTIQQEEIFPFHFTKFYTNERQLRESNFLCKTLLFSLFRHVSGCRKKTKWLLI